MSLGSYPQPTAMLEHLFQTVEEYMMRSYPIRDYPLNIRPAIIFATAAWLLLLGVLGMAPLPTLPINDKALHFFGLGFATFLLYFVIEVPESPARRVWYIRRAPLLFTLVTAFFFGGIISELVQSALPWKEFQSGDILANILGSLLFLYLAHLLHQRSRRRQELSGLYQPFSSTTYRDAQGRVHNFDDLPSTPNRNPRRGPERTRGASNNVWEEESDVGGSLDSPVRAPAVPVQTFDIGDDDDEDDEQRDEDADADGRTQGARGGQVSLS